MPTATEIILEYVCPALGCFFLYFMVMAPVKDVRAAVREGTMGSLNPTPWAFQMGTCLGW
ncbi:hypothetical protein ACHAW5_007207 [Stephanodiscus triporus]|uniref:Uncharacterized protein n=1 Tax=Stephanodiscus triporus TaxID=2934178 RepID=A0ABD3MEA2_9STRA